MFIHSFRLGPYETNCYLIAEGGLAAVIDPGWAPGPVLDIVRQHGFEVTHVLLTHMHQDHICGVAPFVEATGAAVYASARDAYWLDLNRRGFGAFGESLAPDFNFEPLEPGRMTVVNQPCIVLDTPGHSPGSLSFHFPLAGVVFTGDTLFRRSVGRTDLPGGDADTLFASIRNRIFILPDDTEIHPGHGPESTVGEEKRFNPFFRGK